MSKGRFLVKWTMWNWALRLFCDHWFSSNAFLIEISETVRTSSYFTGTVEFNFLQCTVFGSWLACYMIGKWELGHGSLVARNFFYSFLYLFWLLVIYKFVIAWEILGKGNVLCSITFNSCLWYTFASGSLWIPWYALNYHVCLCFFLFPHHGRHIGQACWKLSRKLLRKEFSPLLLVCIS